MNKHRGLVELTLADGRKVPLKATWDALGHLQDDLGCGTFFEVPQAVLEVASGKRNPRAVTDFIYRLGNAAGESFADRDEAARLELEDPLSALAIIVEAFKAGGWFKQLEDAGTEEAEAGNAPGPNRKLRRAATKTKQTA